MHEAVVFPVSNFRLIENVIKMIVMEDLGAFIEGMVPRPSEPNAIAERLQQDHGIRVSSQVILDALASLEPASAVVSEDTAITVSPRKSSELGVFQWVNTIIGNFKTAVRGTYHHINVHKYLARYLAEAQYRLNRRFTEVTCCRILFLFWKKAEDKKIFSEVQPMSTQF